MDAEGDLVMVEVGDRVGYWRVADPVTFVAFDAEEPIVEVPVWGVDALLRRTTLITSDR